MLAAGDVLSLEPNGGGGGDDKTAFAAELQGEAAGAQVICVYGCVAERSVDRLCICGDSRHLY